MKQSTKVFLFPVEVNAGPNRGLFDFQAKVAATIKLIWSEQVCKIVSIPIALELRSRAKKCILYCANANLELCHTKDQT